MEEEGSSFQAIQEHFFFSKNVRNSELLKQKRIDRARVDNKVDS